MTTVQRLDPQRPRGTRFYVVDGDRLPSVTSVLAMANKPSLVPWATRVALENVRARLMADEDLRSLSTYEWWVENIIAAAKRRPDEVRDEAADYGLRLHKLVESSLRGEYTEVPEDLQHPVMAFQAWLRSSRLTVAATERVVWCKEPVCGYAGTLDVQAEGEDELFGTPVRAVVEIKTSNAIYPEYMLQVAAYAHALEQMDGVPVDHAIVLRLSKVSPEFEARTYMAHELENAMKGFLGLLQYWRWKNEAA